MAGVYAEILGFILAVKQCGFRAVRADKISKPGIITDQLIQHVINARMVVADLTGHNANGMGRRQKAQRLGDNDSLLGRTSRPGGILLFR